MRVALLLLALVPLAATRARAQTFTCPGSAETLTLVLPVPGASDVPVNAVAHVRAYSTESAAALAAGLQLQRVLPVLRETVATSNVVVPHRSPAIATIRMLPADLLLGGETYAVVDMRGLIPADLGTFVTAPTLDADAPGVPMPTVTVGPVISERGAGCAADRVRSVEVRVPASSEPLLLTVREEAAPLASDEPLLALPDAGALSTTGLVFCDRAGFDAGIPFFRGERRWLAPAGLLSLSFQVRDVAGNGASSAGVVRVDTTCPEEDGGVTEPDAGVEADAGEGAIPDAGGADAGDAPRPPEPPELSLDGGAPFGCSSTGLAPFALLLVCAAIHATRLRLPRARDPR